VSYYMSKTVGLSFDEAVEKVTEELKKEGFGILTEIDVQRTLKRKLNVDFRKYKILGACNPPLAYEALRTEDKIGVMLPCNVVVQETSQGEVEVFAMDPMGAMEPIDNPDLRHIAEQAQGKLNNVLDRL
jgi:uncharacterized protein (DUF302 family)